MSMDPCAYICNVPCESEIKLYILPIWCSRAAIQTFVFRLPPLKGRILKTYSNYAKNEAFVWGYIELQPTSRSGSLLSNALRHLPRYNISRRTVQKHEGCWLCGWRKQNRQQPISWRKWPHLCLTRIFLHTVFIITDVTTCDMFFLFFLEALWQRLAIGLNRSLHVSIFNCLFFIRYHCNWMLYVDRIKLFWFWWLAWRWERSIHPSAIPEKDASWIVQQWNKYQICR